MIIQFGFSQPTVQWQTFKTFMFVLIYSGSLQNLSEVVDYQSTLSIYRSLQLQSQNTNQNFHMA